MEQVTKKCEVCGAGMTPKIYVTEHSSQATPEVWVCPNREDGKHPDEAETVQR